MKAIVLAVLLMLCLASPSHAARIDTSFVFSSIETPNFSIHYHQGLEAVAQKAARIAEDVHQKLAQEFDWHPDEKTQLVLIDNSDFANGLTTALPYNAILIQVVPPSLESSIGEYDDWLKVLITHEYAHIVTLDPSRGYWKVMRSIFGKPIPGADPFSELFFIISAPPNSFLPRWWHEGMATWAETEFSGEARGSGSYYDMIFRMAVARNALPSIDKANGDVPYWPAGNLRYLYGYQLQRFIAERYGKEALGKLNLAHAGRFPYFINGAPQRLFNGKSYSALYRDMLDAMVSEQREKIKALSRAPFTPTVTLADRGEQLGNPRFSPDGSRIAYTRRDPHDHTTTVIADRTGSKVLAQFRRLPSDGNNCWSPDGGSLYFTQAEIDSGFNVYQDLYSYDLAPDRITRLTRGERLSAADLSPDGKQFAAVASSRGSQNLALLDRQPGAQEAKPRLVTGYTGQRVSAPRWSPDGSTISYALRDNSGRSSLHLYLPASGEDRTLFTAGHTVDFPVWSRDGSFIIYVSDETGVFNLFVYDLTQQKSYQLSHLLGGALQPDLSPDGRSLAFSSYDARGFSIAQLCVDRDRWQGDRGPSLPLTRVPAPAASAPTDAVNQGKALGAPLAASPYRALDTLLPHFWLPRLSADGSGSAVFGFFTAGADVLGYQSYALSADYSAGRKRGYFNLDYRNDYFYPTFSLKAHSEPFLYADLQQRGDYYELNQGFSVEAAYPINFLESRYLLGGGYQLQDQSALSHLSGGRFNGLSVFQGRRDNLFAGISFDNALKYPYSISPEEGRSISLLYRRYDRVFGSDLDYSELSARYQEYLRLPTPGVRHQVLYLRLSGALADLNQKYGQQAFQIGGVPSDLNPYPVRGYPTRSLTGKYVATGTLEYRAPFFYPLHGFGTLPAFLEKVHGALFVDAGEVWDDQNSFSADRAKVGAGVEARLDLTLGYWLKVTPALGFAHGFRAGGENQVYLTVYVNM